MRIRHALPEFGRVPTNHNLDSQSGIVRAAVTIATRQAEAEGRQVELIGLNRERSRMHYRLGNVQVRTTGGWRFGRWSKNDWRYFLPVYATAARTPCDILHAHDNPFLLALPRAGRRLLHIHTPIQPRCSSPFNKAAERADGVICNSEYIRQDFLSCIDFPPDKVYVVHNAADNAVFSGGDGASLRMRLGIGPDDMVALFVGQLSPEKGLIHLIYAFRDMNNGHHLLVAGSTNLWQTVNSPLDADEATASTYEDEIRRLASGLPVHFLGKVPSNELKHVYAACDVFVCPSIWPEPFGMVNVEAMAAGKAVIASRVGGIPEIVVEGETGFLVEAGDPTAIAEAIRSLFADKELLRRVGEAGSARAREHFTWRRTLAQIEEIYFEVTENNQ